MIAILPRLLSPHLQPRALDLLGWPRLYVDLSHSALKDQLQSLFQLGCLFYRLLPRSVLCHLLMLVVAEDMSGEDTEGCNFPEVDVDVDMAGTSRSYQVWEQYEGNRACCDHGVGRYIADLHTEEAV